MIAARRIAEAYTGLGDFRTRKDFRRSKQGRSSQYNTANQQHAAGHAGQRHALNVEHITLPYITAIVYIRGPSMSGGKKVDGPERAARAPDCRGPATTAVAAKRAAIGVGLASLGCCDNIRLQRWLGLSELVCVAD